MEKPAKIKETRPVLIVGAGPTGLVAATELVRLGVPVRLVDRYSMPSDTSRALAVQCRTLELMQQRGLAQEMLKLGNKAFSARLHSDGKVLAKIDLHPIHSHFNFILLLSQSETERILRDKLEKLGVVVERETELIDFSHCSGQSSGVKASLRKANGEVEVLEAAYLIDAEGAHSLVRHRLGLKFEGKSLPNSYIVADLCLDGDLPENELSIFVPESGLIAAFPMGKGRFRIIATEKQEVPADAPSPTLQEIEAAWSKSASVPVKFHDLKWSSRFHINSRSLNQLRQGSIFFAGDSAHIHSPAGGQGMNTGIQDVINLGWKLAMVYQGHAKDQLLDTYSEERIPIIHRLLATTEQATDFMNSDLHFVHVLLQHILPVAFHLNAVKEKAATTISELGANYRKSSLNGKNEGTESILVGDRFPEVLDLLDPSRITLLSFAQDEVDLSSFGPYREFCAQKRIMNPSAHLIKMMGSATTALVRPDGYLLCAGDAQFVSTELKAWFEKWFCLLAV